MTFAVVNGLALYETKERRIVSVVGLLGSTAAVVVLVQRQIENTPWTIAIFGVMVLAATAGRHILLRMGMFENEE